MVTKQYAELLMLESILVQIRTQAHEDTGLLEAVIEWSGQRGCKAAEYNLGRVVWKMFTLLRSGRALVASLTSGMKF